MSENNFDNDNTDSFQYTNGGRILHYKLIECIGGGGMGNVFLARDETLDRLVALKTLTTKLSSLPHFRERLRTEAKAAARLTHKNICGVFAIEETDEQLFIAMEYIRGTTLRDMIRNETLEIEQIRNIAKQCCDGLQAAYDEGIVHRDIKPSNIMLDKYGTVKILDFGLARITTDDSVTETSDVMGTYQYMSPEQITGGKIDHCSDLFSLGVVLYEVLTSHLPFEGDGIAAMAYAIVHNDPLPITDHRDDVPGELELVIARSLCKDVEQRYESASQMKADLDTSETGALPTVFSPFIRSNTIAVFPFQNFASDADDNYLSEGICEDVITAIVKTRELSAASQSAIKRLLKRDMDHVEISQKLKAAYFLEGSLRRQGDTIRLNIQMTQTSDEIVVWSETYERKTEDVFSLQRDIATQIAAALNITLTGTELKAPAITQKVNPEAYELYLRGKFHLKQRDETSVMKAVDFLFQATELDNSFAEAYGKLAVACGLCENYGYGRSSNIVGKAREFAEKAVDLDPGSSQAHMSMFFVLRFTNIRRAITELRTATALDESNSEAQHYLSQTLMNCGYYISAEKAELAANRLDPFMEMSDANLCRLYFLTNQSRKLDRQIQTLTTKYSQSHIVSSTNGWLDWCRRSWDTSAIHYEKALSIEPFDSALADRIADCHIRMDDPDRAIAVLKEGLVKNPNAHMLHARLGQAYMATGNTNPANEHFGIAESGFHESAERHHGLESMHHYFHLAWLSALKNDTTATMQNLQAAVEKDYGHYAELRIRPDWDLLQSDDEFKTFIADLEKCKTSEDKI